MGFELFTGHTTQPDIPHSSQYVAEETCIALLDTSMTPCQVINSSSSRLLAVSATVKLYYVLNPISKSDWPTAVHLHSLACLIQLKDSSQIYLYHNAFRAGIHSLRSNHEMQSQIKGIKAEKSCRTRAPYSNLELSAILNQKGEN